MHASSSDSASWVARVKNQLQWLQVKFGQQVEIRRVATQGRLNENQWVKSYTLNYSSDGLLFKQYQTNKHETVSFYYINYSVLQVFLPLKKLASHETIIVN